MTTDTQATSTRAAVSRPPVRIAVVVVLSFLLGGLTSYAQGGFLPDALSSFANSGSGWTLLTVLLVYWSRARAVPAAVLGAVSFVLLVLGYMVAHQMRGFVYDPVHYSIVGVVLGPFVGVAAAWLRATGVRAAISTALLAGIALGECVHGLTIIRETTSPVYWTVIGIAGLALMAWTLVRRIRGALPVALASGGPLVVAAAFYLAFAYLPYVRF
ncbi:hypothetical protein APR04_001141 [Promicromonospora umidemergens]|uniref:Uncharacterized protein n=1 Tax=Promicromonospora umidemergens TaxID=629679 RepID=A0ABP8YD77_9MICO|nr:DUF6518 family protein [Promicromonospora umidemergens]MCP2282246.1 hypothetical protein [Promicromonospora umidemergens]